MSSRDDGYAADTAENAALPTEDAENPGMGQSAAARVESGPVLWEFKEMGTLSVPGFRRKPLPTHFMAENKKHPDIKS